MLDKITYNSTSKVCPVTQVIEKTITPDKVTDIYKEVREEVINSILRTVVIKDNRMEGVLIEYQDSYGDFQRKWRGRFTINNKEYLTREEIPLEKFEQSKEEVADQLYNAYKNAIADKLLKESIHLILRKT